MCSIQGPVLFKDYSGLDPDQVFRYFFPYFYEHFVLVALKYVTPNDIWKIQARCVAGSLRVKQLKGEKRDDKMIVTERASFKLSSNSTKSASVARVNLCSFNLLLDLLVFTVDLLPSSKICPSIHKNYTLHIVIVLVVLRVSISVAAKNIPGLL